MARYFQNPLTGWSAYKEWSGALREGRAPVCLSGNVDSGVMHLATELTAQYPRVLVLTYNEVRAKELCEDASAFLAEPPQLYPARDLLFYGADVQGSLLARERMQILKLLLEKESGFVVTTADALLDRLSSPAFLRKNVIRLKTGAISDISDLSRRLAALGFSRTEVVEMPGEFSVRGGILDIYPLTEENPVRIEFWDDEIDAIRSFDPSSQRSLENLEELAVYPAREGGDEAGCLLDYFSGTDCLVLDEPERIRDRAEAVAGEYQESMLRRLEAANAEGAELPHFPSLHEVPALMKGLNKPHTLILTGLDYRDDPVPAGLHDHVETRSLPSYAGHFDLLIKDLEKAKKEKTRTVLLCGSRARAERLSHDLSEYELNAFYAEEEGKEVMPGQILVTYGSIHKSFSYPSLKFSVLSEGDVFGKRRAKKRRSFSSGGQKISAVSDLSVGDYVIHEDHGLGIYCGIEKKIVDHIERDYFKISYKDGGNLYAPVTQLNRIEKYASADADPPPSLNRLGGVEWQKTKTRVKKAVADIAKDLVALYAARAKAAGYVYGPDTVWQKEFEEQFPYEETEDQLKAIEAVKNDMEAGKVMDRLICGDVGFGKTEIALRAAFKAVQESKQVAYLVPTTILAQQHYQTFVERLKDYPVRVAMLSRFRSPAAQKKAVSELKRGAVDIVIGTHRLLSQDVSFKDLGLLIIDEEQRFGVADKEKIKKLKENVGVLSLTATPIPRTLHMSLIGIRDLSLLEEPPMDRVPIQTYVAEYNDEIVREAIARELARGGQVYYVSNKVKNIAEVTAHVQRLAPDASVAFAHGQMKERELEQIMYDFVSGDIDVLVSTTIIETGLDIPNVNTIIIADSDRYGLSQLYQLRGRVGRSNRTAYAFLFYRRGRMLKEVAEKRLQAIRDYTELGSGVRISMRDLELRGAGNLLGAEQHGHMEAVGYDLYCKMLGTAIREEKGEAKEFSYDTSVDLAVDANIPASYIRNESWKMDIYRRIAQISSRADYEDMQDELIDRFGSYPKPVEHLLRIALLKAEAHSAYVTEIGGDMTELRVSLLKEAPIDPQGLIRMAQNSRGRLKLTAGDSPMLLARFTPGQVHSPAILLSQAEELIQELKKAEEAGSLPAL